MNNSTAVMSTTVSGNASQSSTMSATTPTKPKKKSGGGLFRKSFKSSSKKSTELPPTSPPSAGAGTSTTVFVNDNTSSTPSSKKETKKLLSFGSSKKGDSSTKQTRRASRTESSGTRTSAPTPDAHLSDDEDDPYSRARNKSSATAATATSSYGDNSTSASGYGKKKGSSSIASKKSSKGKHSTSSASAPQDENNNPNNNQAMQPSPHHFTPEALANGAAMTNAASLLNPSTTKPRIQTHEDGFCRQVDGYDGQVIRVEGRDEYELGNYLGGGVAGVVYEALRLRPPSEYYHAPQIANSRPSITIGGASSSSDDELSMSPHVAMKILNPLNFRLLPPAAFKEGASGGGGSPSRAGAASSSNVPFSKPIILQDGEMPTGGETFTENHVIWMIHPNSRNLRNLKNKHATQASGKALDRGTPTRGIKLSVIAGYYDIKMQQIRELPLRKCIEIWGMVPFDCTEEEFEQRLDMIERASAAMAAAAAEQEASGGGRPDYHHRASTRLDAKLTTVNETMSSSNSLEGDNKNNNNSSPIRKLSSSRDGMPGLETVESIDASNSKKVVYCKEVDAHITLPAIPPKYLRWLRQRRAATKEIRNMLKIGRHRNVVNLYEVLELVQDTKSTMFLVLELVKGGELFDLISSQGEESTKTKKHKKKPKNREDGDDLDSTLDALANVTLSGSTLDDEEEELTGEDQMREFFRELASGVSYCHANGIAHRDLKPENLLVHTDPKTGKRMLKIADFGLSATFAIANGAAGAGDASGKAGAIGGSGTPNGLGGRSPSADSTGSNDAGCQFPLWGAWFHQGPPLRGGGGGGGDPAANPLAVTPSSSSLRKAAMNAGATNATPTFYGGGGNASRQNSAIIAGGSNSSDQGGGIRPGGSSGSMSSFAEIISVPAKAALSFLTCGGIETDGPRSALSGISEDHDSNAPGVIGVSSQRSSINDPNSMIVTSAGQQQKNPSPLKRMTSVVGSPHYVAPEIVAQAASEDEDDLPNSDNRSKQSVQSSKRELHDPTFRKKRPTDALKVGYDGTKADVWSAGVILYAMLFKSLPFGEDLFRCPRYLSFHKWYNEAKLIQGGRRSCGLASLEPLPSISNDDEDSLLLGPHWFFPTKTTKESRDLIVAMLNPDPYERLSIEQVEQHPWLQMNSRANKAVALALKRQQSSRLRASASSRTAGSNTSNYNEQRQAI